MLSLQEKLFKSYRNFETFNTLHFLKSDKCKPVVT
jgi:hypothetical protein